MGPEPVRKSHYTASGVTVYDFEFFTTESLNQ